VTSEYKNLYPGYTNALTKVVIMLKNSSRYVLRVFSLDFVNIYLKKILLLLYLYFLDNPRTTVTPVSIIIMFFINCY
jgi:hypothetical protein